MAARLVSLLAAAAFLFAACGGGAGDDTSTDAPATAAWAATLAALELTPDQGFLQLSASGSAPELEVTITVPKGSEQLAFADGLYGVVVYTYAEGAWTRVDTADVRTEIAPLLGPGESAAVAIPVKEADSYRVLVPVAGRAAWVDLG